jgi:hypothetical protein
MHNFLAGSFVAAAVILSSAEQKPPPPTPTDARTPITLIGCVSKAPNDLGEFTFVQSETRSTYRLTGKSVRQYAGKRVEIVGGSGGKRLAIRGGLYPSPNVAAQAGDMDPAKVAIASQPGGTSTGTGTPTLPSFNVTRVHGVTGACP